MKLSKALFSLFRLCLLVMVFWLMWTSEGDTHDILLVLFLVYCDVQCVYIVLERFEEKFLETERRKI